MLIISTVDIKIVYIDNIFNNVVISKLNIINYYFQTNITLRDLKLDKSILNSYPQDIYL